MKMWLSRLIFFSGMVISLSATAQDITLKVEYPKVVAVGEQVRLVYTVNTSGGELTAPSFDGFYKLSGPSTSYSTSVQIVNNKRTSETSYSYVYYLQATREGKYTIPPAVYRKGNNSYSSQPAEIEVVRDAAGKSAIAGDVQRGGEQPPAGSDIYIKVLLNKKEVFVGEPLVATVKLYTRIDISGINEIKYPSFNGFLREEIETAPLTSLERENIDGTIYGTGVFQKFLLYPQRTGEIVIDPAQITVLIRERGGMSDPIFGDFFQTFNTVPRLVTGNSGKVVVKPLPGNRPAGFAGAVGSFDIKSEVNLDTLSVNDAVTLKVTISGRGNMKLADAPSIDFPAGLEVYDPKTTTNVVNGESGTSGSKTFEYLIIPRSTGNYTIPAITYSFFDPGTEAFKSVSTSQLSFHAARGTTTAGDPQVFSPIAGEDIRYLGRDIRFIKTAAPPLRKSRDNLLAKRSYYSVYGFAILVFIAVILLRREQVRRNADRAKVMNRKAGRIATRRLKTARKYLQKADNEKFYDEILRALWGYISDKLSIPVSNLSRTNTAVALERKGAGHSLTERLFRLADICESVRYAQRSEMADPAGVYEEAAAIIRQLEGNLN